MNFIFSAAFIVNMLSMTAMLILLSIVGQSHLAADLGIIQAATSALFFAFSANARNIVLATSTSELARSLFNLRVILLTPLVLTSYWLSSTLGGIDPVFVAVIILRRSVEWLGEVDLSERERLADKKFAFRYIFTQTVLFIFAAAWLVLKMPYPFLGLFFWAFIPLLVSARFIWVSLGHFANAMSSINKRIAPHFGSSLAIGVSLYVFRLLLILILGKNVSGDLFAAFAIGGVLGSVFVSAFGPSIAFKEKINGRYRLPALLKLLLWCFAGFGILIVALSFFWPDMFSWSGKAIYYWQAIGFSMIGGVVMTHAQLLRSRLLIHNEKHDLFGPDMLMNMLVIAAVPLAYFSFGIVAVAGLSLIGALLALAFYKSSQFAEIVEKNDRTELLKFVQIATAAILLIPFFIRLSSGVFIDKEMLIWGGDSLMSLPIPTSIFLIYIAILFIGSYRSVHLSLSFMFFSFILMFFTTLIISTSQVNLERAKIILIIQYMLPMGALVLGEMFKTKGLDADSGVERVFLFVLLVLVPLQLIASWLQGGLQLTGYLYAFSIYQFSSYVPVVFVSAYLLVIFSLWEYIQYRKALFLLAPLMGIYTAASLSLIAIVFLIVGMFIFSALKLRLLAEKLPAFVFVVVLASCLGYLSVELFLLGSIDILSKIVFETVTSWQFYIAEISSSPKSFFLGYVDVLEKSVSPGAHNYYLDLIRNFGLIALVPMLVALGHTVRLTYLVKAKLINNSVMLSHLLVLIFLLIIDNATQVSLRQPYSGVFTFFIWGLYIARISKINSPESKIKN